MANDSRRIINLSVSLLAAGVFALTAIMAWSAYRELAAANRSMLINSMADKLIRSAVLTAVERGITSAALGTKQAANADLRQKIHDLREESNATWREALSLARTAAPKMPSDSGFPQVVEHAVQSHDLLERIRQRVDHDLSKKESGVGRAEWTATATHFIEDTVRIREQASTASDVPHVISETIMIVRTRAWIMSEYAGIERGILAFYISSRLPVPPEVLDDLKSYRGVVNHAHQSLQDIRHVPDISPAIQQSMDAMEQEFNGRFSRIRDAVYAAAATGHYPMSGDAWMASATTAVGSILAIVDASSEAMGEKIRQLVTRSSQQLALYLAIAGMAFALALVAMARVRRTADALFHEKELAEVTLHSIGDAVITTDAQGHVDYMNPIAETLTGWGVTEAKGRPLEEVFHIINGVTREAQANPVEKCLKENRIIGLENNTVLISRDGMERVVEDSAAPVRGHDGKVVGAVMVFYDVTLMRNSPHLLSYQATHDALTGLVNRREFERRLTTLVESAKAKNLHHVLLYLDLDQFKIVNDTRGHIAGDKLLRQLSFLLKKRLRDTDTLARLGGDEFGVLLESCPIEPALRIANDLVQIVNDFRFVWQGTTFEIGVSIGMVSITATTGSPAELLSRADSACYAAKDKGRNRVQIYRPEDAELQQRHDEMQWVPRIRDALEENRFVLYCHTIMPLGAETDGRHYCETLVRMVNEEGRIIPPMAFIPAAERYNLMPAIDRWVIRKSLSLFGKTCCSVSTAETQCFINLSATSLMDDQMPDFIREQIHLNNVSPELVCFEITETAAVAHLETAMAFMKKVKEIGCRFALDDFGSGMSSFGYLKNLPVDYLKIDGSFVRNIAINPTDYTMVDAINRVGHVMGIRTIAEFVENDAILEKLREIGVDFAQGFGIAEPEPMGEHLAASAITPTS